MSDFSGQLIDYVVDHIEGERVEGIVALEAPVDLLASLVIGMSKEYEEPDVFISGILKGVNDHFKSILGNKSIH